jgi:hypothetical protein
MKGKIKILDKKEIISTYVKKMDINNITANQILKMPPDRIPWKLV